MFYAMRERGPPGESHASKIQRPITQRDPLSVLTTVRVSHPRSIDTDYSALRVGPAGTGADLRICRKKSQIQRRVALPSPGRPPAQIRRRQDLEMARAEVLTKSFCRNMFALKNRLSHQVDADGEHRRSGWMVDGGQLFPSRNDGAALACARTTPGALVSSFEPPSYLPSLTTITCARRGACSCCSSASSVARVPQDCC